MISWERYQTIVYPFNDGLNNTQAVTWIISVVLASIAIASPYMSTFKVLVSPEYNIKSCAPDSEKMGMLTVSAGLILTRDAVAITAMAVLGHRMQRALTKSWNTNYDRATTFAQGRKLLKVVIVVFTIMILPVDLFQMIVYVLYITNPNMSQATFQQIHVTNTFLNILQASNSFSNVFIYSRMHQTFRVHYDCMKSNHEEESQATLQQHIPLRELTSHENRMTLISADLELTELGWQSTDMTYSGITEE